MPHEVVAAFITGSQKGSQKILLGQRSATGNGDAPCKATDKDYCTDTDSARSFLSQFVSLP